MKEHGILFKAEMVRAILPGTKTQTRREIKPQPPANMIQAAHVEGTHWLFTSQTDEEIARGETGAFWRAEAKYSVGDHLYVKEFWAAGKLVDCMKPRELNPGFWIGFGLHYKASPEVVTKEPYERGRWRHSRFMPKWASRQWLEVTEVRAQKLKEISEEDAIAEGIGRDFKNGVKWYQYYPAPGSWLTNPVESYFSLWDSINGKGSSDQNPWVWVYAFKRVEKGGK